LTSRTIIDGAGAEALLGNGDMLFIPPGKSEPSRLQGAFLSSEDTERLMHWFDARKIAKRAALAAKGLPDDELSRPDIIAEVKAQEAIDNDEEGEGGGTGHEDRDPLFRKAAETCIQHQLGSTSLLQRRLNVGYGRAARIIDQLHAAGNPRAVARVEAARHPRGARGSRSPRGARRGLAARTVGGRAERCGPPPPS
jgi:S-DNA-T family DNA segregation ATPase FtsK/SpoIIIE